MKQALITGGSGFFGGILKRKLLRAGWSCVNIDLVPDSDKDPNLVSIQGDIRSLDTLEKVFRGRGFDVVFHIAAMLAHGTMEKHSLWESNVDGTRNVAEMAKKHGVPSLVFISSNCLWGHSFSRPVREDDLPHPVEIYGASKLEGEKILHEYEDSLNCIIIRCPTIIDEGRLGLLSILFEFIDEGRKVWVIGGGRNIYQWIYAPDLADVCVRALSLGRSDIFNIGSDHVKSFRDVYGYVIDKAGTGARVASLPRVPTILFMKLAHWLNLSPLGPYQYRMIAEDFVFDTSRIKNELGWRPTVTNEEMLYRSFMYYHKHRTEIENRQNVSAHSKPAHMGIIRLLKWLS